MCARAGEYRTLPEVVHCRLASGVGIGVVAVSGDHRSGSGLGFGIGIGVATVLRDQR